jgi:DNA-binding transcriptional LysR family regulator
MQLLDNQDDAAWRRLNWDDVRVFLAVVEAGSLNGAAAFLGMTQPTISRRMEDLEIRLAARLFERSPRGISLTQAGASMRELAAGMARLSGAIMRDVADYDRSDSGRVRLAAPDGVASFGLMPTLPEFLRTNPHIELTIDCGLWPDHPLAGETDLYLDFAEVGASDMVSVPIATFHYALHASQEYLNTYGTPKSLLEVAQHRLVRHAAFTEQRQTWHPKAQAVGDLAARHLVTNSSATMLLAVKNGAGIGSLPTACCTFEPNLVMLDLEPAAHLVLWLRYRPAAERQGRVKRVIEWVQQTFDGANQPWFRADFVHPREFDLGGRPGFKPAARLAEPTFAEPVRQSASASRSAHG